jgi:hypothetical protein
MVVDQQMHALESIESFPVKVLRGLPADSNENEEQNSCPFLQITYEIRNCEACKSAFPVCSMIDFVYVLKLGCLVLLNKPPVAHEHMLSFTLPFHTHTPHSHQSFSRLC